MRRYEILFKDGMMVYVKHCEAITVKEVMEKFNQSNKIIEVKIFKEETKWRLPQD